MEIPNAQSYKSREREESPIPSPEPEIKFNFNDLKEPSQKILENIRPHIEEGSYRIIIGDDASGRIPTLVLSTVVKDVYRILGHEPADTLFYAGDRYDKSEEFGQSVKDRFSDLFTNLQGNIDARVLVVTDSISTGSALRPLIEVLTAKGIAFDIASIGYVSPKSELDSEEITKRDAATKVLGGNVIFGMNTLPGSVYRNPHASGVVRKPHQPVAVRAVGGLHATHPGSDYFGQSVQQEHINAARAAVRVLAQEIKTNFLFKKAD